MKVMGLDESESWSENVKGRRWAAWWVGIVWKEGYGEIISESVRDVGFWINIMKLQKFYDLYDFPENDWK